MRKIILVTAMVLTSASAHAGDRSLSLAGTASPPAVTTAAPATQISEVAPTTEAPTYVDRPPAVTLTPPAPKTHGPTTATQPATTAPVTTIAAEPSPASEVKAAAKQAKPKRKHEWTERRIISELHRHGIYW